MQKPSWSMADDQSSFGRSAGHGGTYSSDVMMRRVRSSSRVKRESRTSTKEDQRFAITSSTKVRLWARLRLAFYFLTTHDLYTSSRYPGWFSFGIPRCHGVFVCGEVQVEIAGTQNQPLPYAVGNACITRAML